MVPRPHDPVLARSDSIHTRYLRSERAWPRAVSSATIAPKSISAAGDTARGMMSSRQSEVTQRRRACPPVSSALLSNIESTYAAHERIESRYTDRLLGRPVTWTYSAWMRLPLRPSPSQPTAALAPTAACCTSRGPPRFLIQSGTGSGPCVHRSVPRIVRPVGQSPSAATVKPAGMLASEARPAPGVAGAR